MKRILAVAGGYFGGMFAESQEELDRRNDELVDKIHNEFDTAYDREQAEMQRLIDGINIPKESKIEDLGNRLLKLGFTAAEAVVKAKEITEKRKTTTEQVELLKSEALALQDLQRRYPLQKFLSVRELKRICKDFNLVYAPVERYKGEVPEKNIIEIENMQRLQSQDIPSDLVEMRVTSFYKHSTNPFKGIRNAGQIQSYLKNWHRCEDRGSIDGRIRATVKEKFGITLGGGYINDSCEERTVKMSGLQICAPLKQLHTEGLNKTEFGYAYQTTQVVRDPVVFEFCRNNMVRIITKWGKVAEDKALINPIEN